MAHQRHGRQADAEVVDRRQEELVALRRGQRTVEVRGGAEKTSHRLRLGVGCEVRVALPSPLTQMLHEVVDGVVDLGRGRADDIDVGMLVSEPRGLVGPMPRVAAAVDAGPRSEGRSIASRRLAPARSVSSPGRPTSDPNSTPCGPSQNNPSGKIPSSSIRTGICASPPTHSRCASFAMRPFGRCRVGGNHPRVSACSRSGNGFVTASLSAASTGGQTTFRRRTATPTRTTNLFELETPSAS